MKYFIQTILLFSSLGIFSCKSLKPNYGTLFKDSLQVRNYYQDELKMMNIQAGDRIVSIGACDGNVELAWSWLYDSLSFVIQDIEPFCIEWFDTLQTYYQSNNGFELVLGTADSLKIEGKYKKVLMMDVFHHIFFRKLILGQIHDIISEDGFLYVFEEVVPETGNLNKNCKLPLWQKDDLIKAFESHGFSLVTEQDIDGPPKKGIYDSYGFVFRVDP